MSKPEGETVHLKRLEDLEPGKQLKGDTENDLSPPDGFDMAKFHRGRKFYCDYLFCVLTAHFFALVIGMSYPDFVTPLVFTKKSTTPEKAKKRYMGTVKHVASWHFGNVWKAGSNAQRSILAVRRMHQVVRRDLKKQDEKNYLSQYDMGLVQSAFFGFPILYPSYFGIRCPDSLLDDYVYFWYGIGHLLGIDPKYNICAKGRAQAMAFCEQIQTKIYIPHLEKPNKDFHFMTSTLLEGWRDFYSGTLSVPMIKVCFQEFTSQKTSSLTFLDQIKYIFWKVLFFSLRNIPWVLSYFNSAIRKEFDMQYED